MCSRGELVRFRVRTKGAPNLIRQSMSNISPRSISVRWVGKNSFHSKITTVGTRYTGRQWSTTLENFLNGANRQLFTGTSVRPDNNHTPEHDENLKKLEQKLAELKPVATLELETLCPCPYRPMCACYPLQALRREETPRPIKYHTGFGVRVNGWSDKEKRTAQKTSLDVRTTVG